MNTLLGSLHVYTGPMFSGKTSRVIREITLLADISELNKVIFINNILDVRDDACNISSHSSSYKGVSNKIMAVKAEKLSDIDVTDYTIIGIDEGNFYEDLYDTIKQWISQGKEIYCAGLDSDYKMNNFGKIHELLPISDSFIKLNALCYNCNLKGYRINAPFTKKKNTLDNSIIDVGGFDKYYASCRNCHES